MFRLILANLLWCIVGVVGLFTYNTLTYEPCQECLPGPEVKDCVCVECKCKKCKCKEVAYLILDCEHSGAVQKKGSLDAFTVRPGVNIIDPGEYDLMIFLGELQTFEFEINSGESLKLSFVPAGLET